MTSPEPAQWPNALSPDEHLTVKSWFETIVDPHYDNGGQTSRANGIALFRTCKQLFETIEKARTPPDVKPATGVEVEEIAKWLGQRFGDGVIFPHHQAGRSYWNAAAMHFLEAFDVRKK